MKRFLRRTAAKNEAGFSLIEALIGMAIVGTAMLGLAQAFLLSVNNNVRTGQIAHASYLAQQQLDYLRTLMASELSTFPSTSRGESADEVLDPNADGFPDFRRITQVTSGGASFAVKVLVFPATAIGKSSTSILADPANYRVRAVFSSVIVR
ncbi:MAG: prepilin-type N-terminal cleavage/methylation domain-containing protein [Candidatus Aminicenantes bacterium]|nr:prepilin-type N-terminal cleavage/methylation domain-containing protein [Candidatus Aminicenantes bacterium]